MDIFLSIVKIIFLTLTVVFIFLYFYQRKLIYHPSTSTPQLHSSLSQYYTTFQTKTQDGISLTHWLHQSPDKKKPWIVVFHGNAGHIESRGYKYQFLAQAGYSILLASYRGYGGNLGQPSESAIIQDSKLLLKELIEKENLSPQNIVLYGESLGSCVAVAMAIEHPVQKMILEGAPSSVLDIGKSVFPFLPVSWILKDTWNSTDRIQKIHKMPLLFIHGKQDHTVPFRFGQKLYQWANPPKTRVWMEHREHNDLLEDASTRQAILQFL